MSVIWTKGWTQELLSERGVLIGNMENEYECVEDHCTNTVEDDRIEFEEVPDDDTGEWVPTGEVDEYGEVAEWTGERKEVQVAVCQECHDRDEYMLNELRKLRENDEDTPENVVEVVKEASHDVT